MKYMEIIKGFFKKETVLCIAMILAVVSMFIVTPDKGYAEYIDTRVLALLFSLMVVTAGLQKQGIFSVLASTLLPNARHTGQLRLLLVFLCFFSSMLITNDVALITFVPFAIIVYSMAGLKEQLLSVVVLQTIAANLGSMLTPVGNPQNLYLYTISGMSMGTFIMTMLPLTLVSAVLLFLCCIIPEKQELHAKFEKEALCPDKKGKLCIAFYVLLFAISLLSVLRVVPYQVPLAVAIIGTVITDCSVLKKVDYSLLITFVSFFTFIGNMGRIEAVRVYLSEILAGRELFVGFWSSQIISNVPATVLLSGFTDNWTGLLKGVNIGGLGTLIASMASLISYKLYTKEAPDRKLAYLLQFTGMNILFAVLLILMENGLFAGTLQM